MLGFRHRTVKIALAVLAVGGMAASAGASAATVGPVKGATYRGEVHHTLVTIKVAKNGKTATATMPSIPGYCQGGSGPETPHPTPGSIAHGALKAAITFTARGSSKPFATAIIKGTFLGKSFDGSEKSTFKASPTCDGQESFVATVAK